MGSSKNLQGGAYRTEMKRDEKITGGSKTEREEELPVSEAFGFLELLLIPKYLRLGRNFAVLRK
jgi:hypothetical protein